MIAIKKRLNPGVLRSLIEKDCSDESELQNKTMLTIAEEILLLVLDEKKQSFVRLPNMSLEFALSGALLMDLAFRNRIDSDLNKLFVLSREPTGDALLDEAMQLITEANQEGDGKFWVQKLARQSDKFKDGILQRLVEKNILKVEEEKILWIFSSRRYPLIDNKERTEVRERLKQILFSNEIPDPHDVAIVGLAHACSILEHIFGVDEIEKVRNRVEQICKMELLGRAVLDSVREIRDIEMMTLHYTRALGR